MSPTEDEVVAPLPASLSPLVRRIRAFEKRLKDNEVVLVRVGDKYAYLEEVIYDSGLVTFACTSSIGPTEIVQSINDVSITLRGAPPNYNRTKKPVPFTSFG